MAANGRQKRRNADSYRGRSGRQYDRKPYLYTEIDGNTARQLEEQEFYVPDDRRAEEIRRSRRNREKALQMSPAYVMFLTMACVAVLAVCVNYLKVQASIRTRITNIEEMEANLEELKDTNEATQSRIAVASDIHQIYKTATEELGMVYPDDSQVIYYDRTESEYVQQYEDIPRE
ncbi:cell division protein FtsL [Lacrimispora sp. NSJ-141]|uniref:Cell division protein FtsL n=1 Tax=Lientehia hominis TaxID=2897778 RepID=A0AAP2RH27_9FIRM|nr:cell division protein FtsL [Lientehia hominis]MCD2491284.1 cell division protein FtsL [Lientehia hominis]